MIKIFREIGMIEHLAEKPEAIQPVQGYIDNKLDKRAAIKTKLVSQTDERAGSEGSLRHVWYGSQAAATGSR